MYLLDRCLKFLVTVMVNPYMKRIQNFGAMKTFHSKDKRESEFVVVRGVELLELRKLFARALIKPAPACSISMTRSAHRGASDQLGPGVNVTGQVYPDTVRRQQRTAYSAIEAVLMPRYVFGYTASATHRECS